ncbi:MAG: hypothetical protein H0X37_14320 [Herpetosiphonaceae bacterium]|nr:hypothetical protein [Herpetosiphonaceae bacterium]
MDKNIGFRRNIFLPWLDATAALCSERDNPEFIRARLDPIVGAQIASKDNRREAIDILINIWVKTREAHPELRAAACKLFAASTADDRIWLHYGLTVLYYSFFRFAAATIGQLSRYQDAITTKEVKQRIFAEMGQLGALNNATERVIFSLRNWGALVDGPRRYTYTPLRHTLATSRREVEEWLLAATLTAHPAQELPFADLPRLLELFPFHFTVTVDDLRHSPCFEVHRQGLGWDMVGLTSATNLIAIDRS